MPIIAESPPLVWGAAAPGEPLPPPITPTPTPTPPPVLPVTPVAPLPGFLPTELVNKHKAFMDKVGAQLSCFKREDITGITDAEFNQHVQIAMIDKALTQDHDMFCSKQAVQNLSTKLKRYVE